MYNILLCYLNRCICQCTIELVHPIVSRMKHVILIVLTIQIVAGRPQGIPPEDSTAQILKYENYKHLHEANKAITQEHSSKLKSTDTGKTVVEMEGIFSFVTPDKTFYQLQYISDEHGYRPRISFRAPGYVKPPIFKSSKPEVALKPSVSSNSLLNNNTKVKDLVSGGRSGSSPLFNSKAGKSFHDKKEFKGINRVPLPSFPGYKAGSNGVIQAQSGKQRPTDKGSSGAVSAVEGVFSFVAPDNVTYEVHYTSDENGYRPRISIKTPVTKPVAFELPVLSERENIKQPESKNEIDLKE